MATNTTKNEAAQPEALLTPTQLAREINCTPQTVNNWHRAGILPARIAIGRVVRFDREEALDALARESRKGAIA